PSAASGRLRARRPTRRAPPAGAPVRRPAACRERALPTRPPRRGAGRATARAVRRSAAGPARGPGSRGCRSARADRPGREGAAGRRCRHDGGARSRDRARGGGHPCARRGAPVRPARAAARSRDRPDASEVSRRARRTATQDSTPVIDALEAPHPGPSIDPSEPAPAFRSALVEEYADEWDNEPMFHYRWFYEPEQVAAADRIARETMPGATEEALGGACEMIRQRMVPRLSFVGSSEQTNDLIEGSFRRQLAILEVHFAQRRYLFGDRPAFADFGLFAQLY